MTTPDRCSACGHQASAGARYCVRCGLPFLPGEVAVTSHTATKRSPNIDLSRRVVWSLASVFVLVAGLLGWSLLDSPDTADPAADPVADSARSDSSDAPGEPSASADAASIRPPPDEADIIDGAVENLVDQPAFTALSGHQIFVADSVGLHRIDADTGEVDEYRRSVLPGALVGRYRDQLILIEEQQRVLAVPAADPLSDPVLLLDTGGPEAPLPIQQARMIDDHRLVLTLWGLGGTDVRTLGRLIVDLDTQDVVEQVAGGAHIDDLTWVAGGGLFEVTGDGFRHLADGIPAVAGRRFVLVYECDGPGDCGRHWIDRRSAERVERPVPQETFWQLEFVDGDDRVLFVNGNDGQRYFDALHGWLLPENVIRGTAGDYFDHPAEEVVGGRVLLAPTVAGIVAYDLDTHAARLLDLGGVELRGVTSIIAVPNINVGKAAS